MKRQKILIATNNPGKFEEFQYELNDLNFEFKNLNQIKPRLPEVEEPHETTWENAIHKARFYAEKSGLLTIAEDTGFFVDYLKGGPGIHAKRFGPTAEVRNRFILDKLKGAPVSMRKARFETSGCVYNPRLKQFAVFTDMVEGVIAKRIAGKWRKGMGYDSIFYYPPLKKLFSGIPLEEKNLVSHRGKVIRQIKFYLLRYYSFVQYLVPTAIIVKEKKMLLTQRRDGRPSFHGKWEFPGGGVDPREDIVGCLKREVKEETGYDITPVEQLPRILTETRPSGEGNYQVFLLIYICKITGGKYRPATAETMDYSWFSYLKALRLPLLPLNKKSIQSPQNREVLLKYVNYQ